MEDLDNSSIVNFGTLGWVSEGQHRHPCSHGILVTAQVCAHANGPRLIVCSPVLSPACQHPFQVRHLHTLAVSTCRRVVPSLSLRLDVMLAVQGGDSVMADAAAAVAGAAASLPPGSYPLTTAANSFLAGVLDHVPALLPFTAPSVNSFERFKPSCWSGGGHSWMGPCACTCTRTDMQAHSSMKRNAHALLSHMHSMCSTACACPNKAAQSEIVAHALYMQQFVCHCVKAMLACFCTSAVVGATLYGSSACCCRRLCVLGL